MTKKIAFSALLLATLFEALIFAEQPGIGYLGFWTLSVLATVYILHSSERLRPDRLWMFLPSLLAAFAVFRYDAKITQIWGGGFCLLALAWAVAWNLLAEWRENVLSRLFPAGTWNPAKLACNARDGLKLEYRWDRALVVQVLRGLTLSAGLLLVFGTLLASADAVFGAKVAEFVKSLSYLAPAPMLRTALWLALAAGGIRLWLTAPPSEARITKSIFAPTELFIALGSVNLLFITFLLVQIRYLFGDSSLVEALGFDHAGYARRGFFELSLCIALILPLVLVAYRAAEVNREGRLRYLGGGLILSASGLAVSALKRMLLYIDVFGLSVDRFYAASGIVVAMAILGWAAYACFKPQSVAWLLARQNLTVIFLLALLSLVDVDALVARSHLRLVEAGTRSLDADYLAHRLSCDALPVYQEFEPRLEGKSLELLRQVQTEVLAARGPAGGASFHYSRWQAKSFVASPEK